MTPDDAFITQLYCPDCFKKGENIMLHRRPFDQGTLQVFFCPRCAGEWTSDIRLERLYHTMPVKDPRIEDLEGIDRRVVERKIKKILDGHREAAGREITHFLTQLILKKMGGGQS